MKPEEATQVDTSGVPARPSVAVSAKSFPPAFRSGGPPRSLAAITEALGSLVDFRVVTSLDDNGHDLSKDGVQALTWQCRRQAEVLAVPPGRRSALRTVRQLRTVDADVLYLNSFFDPTFTLAPLAARRLGLLRPARTVLAPRGELDPGALTLRPRRKSVAIAMLRRLGLLRGITWQATSPIERSHIAATIGPQEAIEVAPNLRNLEPVDPQPRPLPRICRVVLLSKIDRKKNIETAISAVAKTAGTSLTVIGPIKDPVYWDELLRHVEASELGSRFEYRGPVPPHRVVEELAPFDLFLLPSRSENFGHVILEALAAGLPVIVSDSTPWGHVEDSGAGWVRPSDAISEFADCLRRFQGLDSRERQEMRANAVSTARTYLDDPDAVRSTARVLLGNDGAG